MGKRQKKEEMKLEKFSEIIEKAIRESDVHMHINLPKDSMEPVIQSSFGVATIDLYIMLHALRKVIHEIWSDGAFDPNKKEDMIDGILQLVKEDLMKEETK